MAAHFPEHRIGRVGEPGRQRFEGRRIEEPRRRPERLGQCMHRRLVGLEVDREHPGQRPGGQVGAGERALDQVLELACRNAALAAHPEREAPPVIHQGVFVARVRGIGHPHGKGRIGLKLEVRTPQPVRLALQATPLAGQQPGHERLAVLRVREHPSGRRIVERDPPAALAGGGDRGGDAEAPPPGGGASALAPRWPPRRGTTALPSSATATTAGSLRLSASAGARVLTRMPAAHTPTMSAPEANSRCSSAPTSSNSTSAPATRGA